MTKVYVCSECYTETGKNDAFCAYCGNAFDLNDKEEAKQMSFSLRSQDIEMLCEFLHTLMKSKVVANDLFRYLRGLTKAYSRSDNLDISEWVHKAIQDKIKLK